MRRLVSMGVLLVLPAGCAYRTVIQHGETAAAASEWQRAYDAYRFANELKPGKADAELAQARDRAIEAELAVAATAVGSRDYAGAYDHLEAAERLVPALPDPRTTAARDAARDALLADLAARMAAAGDLEQSYAFVALAKGLQPHSPEVEDAAATLRARVEADTKAHLDAMRFAEARDTARLMAALEPAQRTRGHALEETVAVAWVAHLVKLAKEVEKTRPGLAAVHWTRAHEVGGDAAHAEAARVAFTAAAAAGPLDLFVDTQGAGGRHLRLRKTLRAAVDEVPSGATATAASRADLAAVVVANDEKCVETSEKKVLEKEYQSGTRQVDNPAYAEAVAAQDAAEKALDAADADADARRTAHDRAAEALRVLGVERERLQRDHDEKAATLQATQVQVTATGERMAEAEKQLAGADASATAQLQKQIAELKGFNDEWNRKKVGDQAAADAAKAALDKVDAQIVPAKKEEEDTAAALKAAEAKLAEAKTRMTDAVTKRTNTPKTNTENVMDTAKVTETTWTLTCTAPVSVTWSATWPTARAKTQAIEAKLETTDVERTGHTGAAIQADPKAYPKQKADLVAELDASATKAVTDELTAFVSEGFAKRVDASLGSTPDLASATQDLIALAAGAADRLDGPTRTRVTAFLTQHYGIEDATKLGLGPVAAPAPVPAPAATPAPAPASPAPATPAPAPPAPATPTPAEPGTPTAG